MLSTSLLINDFLPRIVGEEKWPQDWWPWRRGPWWRLTRWHNYNDQLINYPWQIGGTTILTGTLTMSDNMVSVSNNTLTATMVTADGTKAVRRMTRAWLLRRLQFRDFIALWFYAIQWGLKRNLLIYLHIIHARTLQLHILYQVIKS